MVDIDLLQSELENKSCVTDEKSKNDENALPEPKNQSLQANEKLTNINEKAEIEQSKLDNNEIIEQFIKPTQQKLIDFSQTSDELTALASDSVAFSGELDELPQFKLVDFYVVDETGTQITLDSGIIEQGIDVYLCGRVCTLLADNNPNSSSSNGQNESENNLLVKIGPIDEWYSSGFDGGKDALVSVFSPYAHYYLGHCAESHRKIYAPFLMRVMILKFIFECIVDNYEIQYNEMINNVLAMVATWAHDSTAGSCGDISVYECSEDFITTHAQFIIDQLAELDLNPEQGEMPFLASPAIFDLIDLSGATVKVIKRTKSGTSNRKKRQTSHKMKEELNVLRSKKMAVTTPLVKKLFDDVFKGQLAKDINIKGKASAAKEKISSPVKSENSDEDDEEGADFMSDSSFVNYSTNNVVPQDIKKRNLSFETPLDIEYTGRKYYQTLIIGSQDEKISVGDFVAVFAKDRSSKIAFVTHFYTERNALMCHIIWMACGNETVLGYTADSNEIFLSELCADIKCIALLNRVDVISIESPKDWFEMGGKFEGNETEKYYREQGILYYKMSYDFKNTRFTYPHIKLTNSDYLTQFYCSNCIYSVDKKLMQYPMIVDSPDNEYSAESSSFQYFKYKNKKFALGDCVFIEEDSVSFKFKPKSNLLHRLETSLQKKAEICNKKSYADRYYTEKHRKNSNSFRNLNYNTSEPWQVGQIKTIKLNKQTKQVMIELLMFCRPSDLNLPAEEMMAEDLNKLMLTDKTASVQATSVVGHANVFYAQHNSVPLYDSKLPGKTLFYFKKLYNHQTGDMEPIPTEILSTFKNYKSYLESDKSDSATNKKKPFNIFDIFSGCGGLSSGIEESGLGKTKWAIEFEESAAEAFRLNHKKCEVFCSNSNDVLQAILDGKETFDGLNLPRVGEVDLLCGGPPCQGFSGMNRFNSSEYSRFKNSLIANCLSFVEKLRPRLVLIENVRNFASFKRSAVLRVTLQALIRMGYQVTFGILQAGCYGISQTRRRTIIMAAAPGENLPYYPEPVHCFAMHAGTTVTIDGIRYESNLTDGYTSAPLRTVSNYDSIGDLPPIKDNPYRQNPENILMDTHGISKNLNSYQAYIRNGIENTPKDHICKEMKDLVYERISFVPTKTGSDWRDLPNVALEFDNGYTIDALKYLNKEGHVCSCAIKKAGKKLKCDPEHRQTNTIIPWCLPHTSDRHNQWSGLYGRLPWSGFFGTTITNPEPMGKQGRVLHPDQNRVISVRECARSQGFKDTFKFYGSILDQHRQIGNAVPPPMAKALGCAILKSFDQ